MNSYARSLDEVLIDHEGVLGTSLALQFMTESQLRWQVASGRWQKAARGVVVAQSGPLTDRQLLRAALLPAGPQGLVRVDDLRLLVGRMETLHRRKLIIEVLADIAGGSQAISELDFLRL